MLLIKFDFEREWNCQMVPNKTSFLKLLKSRMTEMYINNWRDCVQSSTRYTFYRSIKVDHYAEPYLYALDKRILRDALTCFRMGISDLFVYTHRYSTTPFMNTCPLCLEEEEDELHFLLYCPATYDLRMKYSIPSVPIDADNPLLN